MSAGWPRCGIPLRMGAAAATFVALGIFRRPGHSILRAAVHLHRLLRLHAHGFTVGSVHLFGRSLLCMFLGIMVNGLMA